jgi:DNA-binding GntR family transcriptional regulator
LRAPRPCIPTDADVENQSLFQLLESNGYKISYGDKDIQARTANEELSNILKCKSGSPLFFIKTKIFDKTCSPLLLSEIYIRGDIYQITISTKRR